MAPSGRARSRLRRRRVDRDDRASAPAMRAPCTAARPTPPSPMTTTDSPGADLGGVADRADAGEDGAAEQRRLGRAACRRARDAGVGARPRSRWRTRRAEAGVDVGVAAGGAGERDAAARRRRARTGTARRLAEPAGPAGGDQLSTTWSPTARPRDAGADLDDDAGALVAEDDRARRGAACRWPATGRSGRRRPRRAAPAPGAGPARVSAISSTAPAGPSAARAVPDATPVTAGSPSPDVNSARAVRRRAPGRMPECLYPPNGASGLNAPPLMSTCPVRIRRATASARVRVEPDQTLPARP